MLPDLDGSGRRQPLVIADEYKDAIEPIVELRLDGEGHGPRTTFAAPVEDLVLVVEDHHIS